MSNARSPRDVCSTTMGTSGLMLLALFRLVGSIPSGRASLAMGSGRPAGPRAVDCRLSTVDSRLRIRRPDLLRRRFLLLFLRRPELVARLRLIDRDRLRALDEDVDRLAHGHVLAKEVVAALLLHAVERLPDLLVARVAGGLAQRLEQLVVGDLDPLGLDHGREHGLALQRLLRVRLGVLDQLVLVLARELEVLLRVEALALETPGRVLP